MPIPGLAVALLAAPWGLAQGTVAPSRARPEGVEPVASRSRRPAAFRAQPNDRRLSPTRLALRGLDWDTRAGQPHPPEPWSYGAAETVEAGYFIVQATPESYDAVASMTRAAGGRVFDYVPNNAFEAWLPGPALGALRGVARAVVPVHPAFKVAPEVGAYGTDAADTSDRLLLAVELWPDQSVAAAAAAAAALDVAVEEAVDAGRCPRLLVRAPRRALVALARLAAVKWIEESAPAAPRNDRTAWVIQTDVANQYKLWLKGLTGAGVTIGHIDAGPIYEASCYFDDPSGTPPGPGHRKIVWWSGGAGSDSHATHTAGAAAGDSRPVNGSIYRIGMAPDAFLVSHGYLPTSTGLMAMLLEANGYGARIHTNSWGNDYSTAYDIWCRDIDAYSHDYEDALVVFAVTNLATLRNPENAKSVVAAAATQRDNEELFGSGGAGPTADGRLKPEVFAPGCSTFSAAAGASCLTVPMCGTSMACPVVAGGAALLKQYFEDGFYPSGAANPADAFTPSGSLLRACLANSGDDMSGLPGYPSYQEGWGRILLDNVAYFAGDARRLAVVDKLHGQGLATGQKDTYALPLPGGTELRVTLAFADEPGSAFAADPVVNDLNLIVKAPDGTRYHGNILDPATGQWRPNPRRKDPRNTLEMVIIPGSQAGTWRIQVEGKDVPAGPQGYAVVATY